MADGTEIILGDRRKGRRALGRFWRRLRLLLVALIATGCVAWSVERFDEQTRIRQARVDLSRIGHAARLFRADFGRCPRGVGELADPPDGPPYLTRTDDPWGREYRITCPARFDPGGVDVVSTGPDRSPAGEDNISSL